MEQASADFLGLFSGKVLVDSIVRLNPRTLLSNPVMLIVELTFFIVAAMAIYPQGFYPVANASERLFYIEIAIILLITVWFSTLSDSLAETQARTTANNLRTLKSEVLSKKLLRWRWNKEDSLDTLFAATQGRPDFARKGRHSPDRC